MLYNNFINNNHNLEENRVGDICKCVLGGTPSRVRDDYWGGNIPWINSGEVNNFRILHPSEYITQKGLDNSSTKLLPKHTTVIAITGATLGQASLLEIESCANQSVIGILPNKRVPYEFIYPFVKNNIKTLISNQTGGAQQHINKDNVKNMIIMLPNENDMNIYKETTKYLFNMISINCFEINNLQILRDSILPKLMSGEIDVSKIDI